MIENWIIADYELIGELTSKPNDTDGCNGSSVIKKEVGSYSKVIDGVQLLQEKNKSVVYNNSKSYRSFINLLNGIDCDYLDFKR